VYVQNIQFNGEEGRPVIYFHSTTTKSHTWTDSEEAGLKTQDRKGQRVTVVYAGGKEEFIPNALLMFRSGSRSGDCHIQFQKW
jgi:hypothetical protein